MDFTLKLIIFAWVFAIIWIPIVIYMNKDVHPRALFTLFFAEMWERFSFYGMRALLVLYMTKILFVDMGAEADTKALGIYGAYGALVYGMPVFGGMIADKIMGFRKTIIFGGILMALGHFTLAMVGPESGEWLFFLALSFIIVGNGYFKPNISSFLGTFYDKDDSRKDGAFTIFYMGVNLGALLSALTCGYIGETYSWDWGFGLAGIGMVLGIIVFWQSMKGYGDKGLEPTSQNLSTPVFLGLKPQFLVIIGSIVVLPFCMQLLEYNAIMKVALPIMGIAILGYLLYDSYKQEEQGAGAKLRVIIVLFFFHMLFWALFEQAGGSLTLFADKSVDRHMFGSEVPASVFQSVNPFFILLLAPLFSWIWIKLSKSGKEPSTPMKFVLGLGQLALGFGMIVLAGQFFESDGMIPMLFLVLMYLFHTTGELSLSPVGLSMVTKLSPTKIVGFVMGTWFLSISFAHEIAGILGQLTTAVAEDATALDILNNSTQVYLLWGVGVVGAAALLLFFLVPTLRKMMGGIN